MPWCGSFCLPLIWNSLAFLDLDACFLPRFREVFNPLVFLTSFWDPYCVSMLGFAPCPLISSAWVVPLPGIRVHYSFLLFHLVCYWTLLMYFSVQWLDSTAVTSIWYFIIFSISFLKFSLWSSLLNLVNIITTITLDFYQVNYIPFSLRFFQRFLSFSSLWNIFLFLHLPWLLFSVH